MINSGELNRKIVIQQYSSVISANGFETKAWTTILNPYAKIENTNGNKYFNAGSEDLKKNTKFTIRYNSVLKAVDGATLRVVYNEKNYTVLYINDVDEAHIFFEIVGESIGK